MSSSSQPNLEQEPMDGMEALFHQAVPLSLLGEYLVEMCPDLVRHDEVSQPDLRKRRRHKVRDLTSRLCDRGHDGAAGLSASRVDKVLQFAGESGGDPVARLWRRPATRPRRTPRRRRTNGS